MTAKKILSEERQLQVMAAVEEWFLALPGVKTKAIMALGFKINIVHGWRTGLRRPPPPAMKTLFAKTKDRRFLLTAKEKETYLRKKKSDVPNEDGWPDLSETEAASLPKGNMVVREVNHGEKIKIVELMKQLADEIERLSKLPTGNHEREKARRQLAEPAMMLFTAATMLELEFPESFKDLRKQLEMSQGL